MSHTPRLSVSHVVGAVCEPCTGTVTGFLHGCVHLLPLCYIMLPRLSLANLLTQYSTPFSGPELRGHQLYHLSVKRTDPLVRQSVCVCD